MLIILSTKSKKDKLRASTSTWLQLYNILTKMELEILKGRSYPMPTKILRFLSFQVNHQIVKETNFQIP